MWTKCSTLVRLENDTSEVLTDNNQMIKFNPKREYWTEYRGYLISTHARVRRIPKGFFERAKEITKETRRFAGKDHRFKNLIAKLFLGAAPHQNVGYKEGVDNNIVNIELKRK